MNKTAVAIVGMGCVFPNSQGLQGYWRLLLRGEDAIADIPATHFSLQDYYDKDPKKADHIYCKRGGFISPVSFDPTEFGIPPALLEATDTAQLLGLYVARKALEDSGFEKSKTFNRERTSVILGVTGTQELVIPLGARLGHPIWRRSLESSGIDAEKTQEVIQKISNAYVAWQENSFPGLLGNVVAGRISNRLDLGGTNCVVDAACASSLSAVHLAVLELLTGRSDVVVTGGVDTLNDIFMHMCFSKTMVLSATGDARPFSKNADGTVLGEGIGMFVLKRLEDAERDGDKIYAVIRGVGSSSDGKSQSIYAPRAEGQLKALKMAYEQAGIDPATVEMIEAHGTGTRVGDQVEFQALNRLFETSAKNGNRCALGSVKSMIGHTKAAAGAAGLMKTALALYHKVLLPTLKADEPDPRLNIDRSSFYLNTERRPWFSKKAQPRRSGISAFGFGGSNFHAVLEEYRSEKAEIAWDGSVQIAAWSAPSVNDLKKLAIEFRTAAENASALEGLSLMAAESRNRFSSKDPHRLLVVLEKGADLTGLLHRAVNTLDSSGKPDSAEDRNIFYNDSNASGRIALVFPGQGSQYTDMGKDLVCCFPEAFNVLERANHKYADFGRLTDFIYPFPARNTQSESSRENALRNTDVAQPAIGAVSLAMFSVLQSFDVDFHAACGHSFGELSALCAAGRIDLDTFLHLAVTRGRLMADAAQTPNRSAGTMLAVQAPLQTLEELIETNGMGLVLANRNSPNQGVLSGPVASVEAAEALCRKNGFKTLRLPVSAAFHSTMVADAQEPFVNALRNAAFFSSETPVFSNTFGRPYPSDPEAARRLLGEHLSKPVDFLSCIENMYEAGARTFIEVGPKTVLSNLIRSTLQGRDAVCIAMDASAGRHYGIADLARTLCRVASLGHAVELKRWEKPAANPRKQIMRIPITGTNYRPPPKDVPEPPRSEIRSKAPSKTARSKPARNTRVPEREPFVEKQDVMKKPHQNHVLRDALNAVQEGLKSMQALQKQTAETHQKFLETQTQASRTLQNMISNTQRLVEASLGIPHATEAGTTVPTVQFQDIEPKGGPPRNVTAGPADALPTSPAPATETDAGTRSEPVINGFASDPITEAASQAAPDPKTPESDSGPQSAGHERLKKTLLEVVGQLTGYPLEMLALDMDIEADLGIDSIKRVEILSTLEEKVPGLPPVSPEIMGSLKTLGHIVAYLSDATGALEPVQGHNAEKATDSAAALESTLLEVVGQLTGYPLEMLALDMDIEADLGIDSIKRVEILSTLEEKVPGLPPVSPEIMGSLKTLGHIVDYLASSETDAAGEKASNTGEALLAQAGASQPDAKIRVQASPVDPVERKVVKVKEEPFLPAERLALPARGRVVIRSGHEGLARALVEAFSDEGIETVLLPDGSSEQALKAARELSGACGLVIVAGNPSVTGTLQGQTDEQFLKEAFLLARHLGQSLNHAAESSGALFAAVTRMDGAFGFKGRGPANPLQGGLAGLVKTAGIEWEKVRCRALDISPEWTDDRAVARNVVTELLFSKRSGPLEVGLSADTRVTPALEAQPYPRGDVNLEPGDVVVVSGGARGITAVTALELAKHSRPTLVLLGRSPLPEPEPEWMKLLEDEAAVKKAIFENEFQDTRPTPNQIESAFKRYMAHREIARTLENIKQTGAPVHYVSVDVRNADAVRSALDAVRREYGPIKGVIHAAGVLEDCRIVEKTAEQFNNVFDPKVKGLFSLLEATREDPLEYLVVFSSVAARFGNNGQADYAVANEVLNKVAQRESAARPRCRVISINWGPWDGGMVCSALKRKFQRDGVDLIPLEAGARSMILEMAGDKRSPVEVVLGAGFETVNEKDHETTRSPAARIECIRPQEALSLTVSRDIDVDRYPILGAHVLGGKPVVPLALIAEWLAHGALHENPGLLLQGLDNLQLLQGIKLDRDRKTIRLLAGKARKAGDVYEVDVEIRDGVQDGIEKIHSRATAILTDKLDPPPAFNPSRVIPAEAPARSINEIYREILFHGRELRGIREVIGCSPEGIVARLSAAPSPAAWMKDPLRSKWIGDPLVLDSAFQMAIIWCHEQVSMLSLPSSSAVYRQYCREYPAGGVTAVLEVREVSRSKMKGDFTFLDDKDSVVARLIGYEAIMDASLSKAFKAKYAA